MIVIIFICAAVFLLGTALVAAVLDRADRDGPSASGTMIVAVLEALSDDAIFDALSDDD